MNRNDQGILHAMLSTATCAGACLRWHAIVRDMAAHKHLQLSASYAILAVGLHSQPYMPSYPGQNSFLGQQMHSRNMQVQSRSWATSGEPQ